MGQHRGLGGLLRGCLAIERHARQWPGLWKWTWMVRHAGMDRSFAMWALNQEAKSLKSAHSAGERTNNSLGNGRGDPYTSSVEEVFKSSFHALQIPNSTIGKASVQCSPAWHINAAFSWWCSLSTKLLEAGCDAVVRVSEDPWQPDSWKDRPQIACPGWLCVWSKWWHSLSGGAHYSI
jgi:hypothetical protein